ncbi:MAG: hypothetical protein QNJ68_06215 [Microcoleaceae cyanobacterium MO_207.B10]|nr:hypothetical protein [Microcoleaceae cyanobacterium MO_207.B10]
MYEQKKILGAVYMEKLALLNSGMISADTTDTPDTGIMVSAL